MSRKIPLDPPLRKGEDFEMMLYSSSFAKAKRIIPHFANGGLGGISGRGTLPQQMRWFVCRTKYRLEGVHVPAPLWGYQE